MSLSHYLTFTWAATNGANPVTNTVTVTADSETNLSFTAPTGTTNVVISLTRANMKSLYVSSDQPVTLETNGVSSAAQDTYALAASEPLVWYSDSGLSNPFSGNVSSIYVVNAGTTTANVTLKSLSNN